VGVQQQAYYDIGNTQYRLGQKTEKSAPQETIKTWQDALQSYDAALKLKPDDGDAKFNRDFVQKKLDQLQKQQPQQKQDQQKQDQQNQKQDQQNQQQQSGSPQNQQNNQANQQNQSGSPQNQNGQQGQPKDQQSGQPQTAGNQGQKSPANGQDQQKGNSGDQNSQLGQNNAKPAGPSGPTVPDKDSSKPQPGGNEAEADKPGEMSAQEAKDLLNSLKNGEHVLPVTADARNGGNHSPDDQPLKDW
jgi:Ca-activated chloride channel family protein